MDCLRAPPSIIQQGRPSAFPRMSHKAMSSAPIPQIPMPRRPAHIASDEQLFPESLGLHGILANEHFLQTQPENMGSTGVDHGAGDPWIGVDLSDARDALIGMDFNDDVILRGRTGAGVIVGNE